jgi:MYXO-CTERM domain-containing protein
MDWARPVLHDLGPSHGPFGGEPHSEWQWAILAVGALLALALGRVRRRSTH